MKKIKAFTGLLALFVVVPIWLYLFYCVLSAVDASELMWFLYWIYVPASAFVVTAGAMLDKD